MERSRWWHVAVVGIALVLSALVVLGTPSQLELIGGLTANAVFVAAWFLVGRHSPDSPAAAAAFLVITIAVATVGTALSPSMATIQCIGYPLIWVISHRVQTAIFANIALATGVGVGLYISTTSVVQALVIQAISLSFSMALGLWITAISNRSHERQRLLDELRAAQDRLAAVSRDAGIASERERLAREIHDTIAQDLTGLIMMLQRTQRDLAAGRNESIAAHLVLLEESARSTLAETRALVAATSSVALDGGGIVEALQRLGERFGRETSVQVTVNATGSSALDRDTEVVLLRCAQEALANVRKHSGASSAVVTLTAEPRQIRLEVLDDGTGFDPELPASGYGLGGMRDRLALVGGTLLLASSEEGTTLTATLPTEASQ